MRSIGGSVGGDAQEPEAEERQGEALPQDGQPVADGMESTGIESDASAAHDEGQSSAAGETASEGGAEGSGDDAPSKEEPPGGFVPYFESAIPMGEDRFGIDARQERMPRLASFLVAAAASIVVIGGTMMFITHPWDKASFSTRASDAADVSQAGYPGEVEALTGQDSLAKADKTAQDVDARAFEILSQRYVRLGELRAELAKNETDLRDALASDDATAIAGGYGAAESASIETASIQNDLTSPQVATSSYREQGEKVAELAGWLNSWSQALVSSWGAMDGLYYPSYAEDSVVELLFGGNPEGSNGDMVSFDENYVSRFPVQVTRSEEGTAEGTEGGDAGSGQAQEPAAKGDSEGAQEATSTSAG